MCTYVSECLYLSSTISNVGSDQLESLCSFDHYAPSLYQINLKLLIQNIIICKILYTFPCFVNSAVPE